MNSMHQMLCRKISLLQQMTSHYRRQNHLNSCHRHADSHIFLATSDLTHCTYSSTRSFGTWVAVTHVDALATAWRLLLIVVPWCSFSPRPGLKRGAKITQQDGNIYPIYPNLVICEHIYRCAVLAATVASNSHPTSNPNSLHRRDLSGIWRGHGRNLLTKLIERLKA